MADLELDGQGRLWAGYEAGLAWLDPATGQWQLAASSHPIHLVRSFTFAGRSPDDDAVIWIVYQTDGGLARLTRAPGRNHWEVEDLTRDAGYAPAAVSFVKRDSRGWIWCGTANGVRVSDGVHTGPADWLHLTVNHGADGVAMSKYGFFEDPDGSVWLAGSEGVTHVRAAPSWFAAPGERPQITRIQAGATTHSLAAGTAPAHLPEDSSPLRIDVSPWHASPFREVPLRYRLLPVSEEWIPAPNATIELGPLPARAYELEAAYNGTGPTAALRYAFRVGPPGPLQRFGPWAAMLLIGAGLARWNWNRLWGQRLRYRLAKLAFRASGSFGPRTAAGTLSGDLSEEVVSDRYHLVGILSRGGFSTVFAARDNANPETPVALKAYHRRAADFPWVRDRFAHEVAALRMIHHPGVVPLLDSWIDPNGMPCLVCPLLPGETLRQILQRGTVAPARAAGIIRSVGETLSEVHRRGIVHRDLKPENILLRITPDGRDQPVLIDFGNAGLLGAAESIGTTRLLTGTLDYMAPEQIMYHYAAASDLYAFGIVILEMLTARRLVDLGGYDPSPRFCQAIARVLDTAGCPNHDRLAAELAAVFVPEPSSRPTDVNRWSVRFADLLCPAEPHSGEGPNAGGANA